MSPRGLGHRPNHHRTRAVFPHLKLLQVYGLSETGFLTALQDHEHTPKRLLSCGRPGPGVDVRVVDDTGKELGIGRPGELVARGANVMRGYWNNAEETAVAFRNGLFRTGASCESFKRSTYHG